MLHTPNAAGISQRYVSRQVELAARSVGISALEAVGNDDVLDAPDGLKAVGLSASHQRCLNVVGSVNGPALTNIRPIFTEWLFLKF
jgi:hypothetical protein